MATYSRSPRLLAAYQKCTGLYTGFGPVGVAPTRLKVTAFFSKKTPGRLAMMLNVAAYK